MNVKEAKARIAAQREIAMYGCEISKFQANVESSFTFKRSGPAMIVMSLLSDAQEETTFGMTETARQTINRAKWVLSTYVMKD
jgi:hypothetical protein